MELSKITDVSQHGYPSSILNPLTKITFTLDNVECNSIEGFIQALKFDKTSAQLEVCKLFGVAAKNRGRDRSGWKTTRRLWWKGLELTRDGDDYSELLDQAFLAIARQNEPYRKALLDTGETELTYSIGKTSPSDTTLTRHELCSRLEKLRRHLQKGHDLKRVTQL